MGYAEQPTKPQAGLFKDALEDLLKGATPEAAATVAEAFRLLQTAIPNVALLEAERIATGRELAEADPESLRRVSVHASYLGRIGEVTGMRDLVSSGQAIAGYAVAAAMIPEQTDRLLNVVQDAA